LPNTWAIGVDEFSGGAVDEGRPYAPGGPADGSQIAGYRIEEQVGRGGMAVVYRATDVRLNRPVALKILAPELARDGAFRERFIREMRAAAAVGHPHIVPVFDAGESNGALYIAMLYAGGHDVRTLIAAQGPLPAPRVADIVAQVASALDEAHSRGMIHRDVKPANMLLASRAGNGQRDHVYLSDFGLSKQSFSAASLTLTGQFLGTIDYMAPEQVEGSPIDGRADQYGLACAAFEMFTGAPPFKRDQDFAAIFAQLSAPAPSLLSQRPDLPPAVDKVIARALAKSTDDRYLTCGEFASALTAACGRLAALQPPTVPMASPVPQVHSAASRQAAQMAQAGPPARPAPPRPAGPPRAASPPRPAGPPRPAIPGRPLVPAGRMQPSGRADLSARPEQPRQPAPPPPPRGGYRPPRDRRPRPHRAAIAGGIAGSVAMLAVAGILFAVLRGGSAATTPPAGTQGRSSQPVTSSVAGPAATVEAYFTAINNHDYARAWDLGGRNTGLSYSSFVQGFEGTASDDLTVVSVSGDVVTIRLAAMQTDGSVKQYQGTYTVSRGVITRSHIRPGG
jgi:serine/threonine protein kinase